MTEREILKHFVDTWDGWSNGEKLHMRMTSIVAEAKALLAASDPSPEHPAVVAYRKWGDSLKPRPYAMSEGFLAGWKQALAHIAENFDDGRPYTYAHTHLMNASNDTPTHLP